MLRLMEGFDHYTTGGTGLDELKSFGYTAGGNNDESIIATTERVFLGVGKSVFFTTNNRHLKYDLVTPITTVGTLFHFQPVAASTLALCSFYDSADALQLTLVCNNSGQLEVRRGAYTGTLLATSASQVFFANTYTHVEVKVLFSQTVGTVEVRVNGIASPVINISGQDTCNTTNENCRYVSIGSTSGSGGAPDCYFDNWYIWDNAGSVNNDFLGQRRVETVVPDADTATEDFDLSAGSDSFALVDEIGPDGDTTYLFSATPGDRTVLDFANLSSVSGTCLGVAMVAYTRKTDVGDASYMLGTISNSVEDQSADINPITTYKYDGYHLLELDPDGDVAWTPTTAQAAQVSLENTTV